MNMVQWDSGKELRWVRSQIDQLWNEFLGKLSEDSTTDECVGFLPDVDIVETSNDVRVFIGIPGILEEDIILETSLSGLTVRGERHPPYDSDRKHVREWKYGYFERSIELTTPVDLQRLAADCDSGVLTVVIPKVDA